jgi:hypothetical protein
MKLDHVGRRVNDATHPNVVGDELRPRIVSTSYEAGKAIRDVGIRTLHTVPDRRREFVGVAEEKTHALAIHATSYAAPRTASNWRIEVLIQLLSTRRRQTSRV